MTIGIIGAGNIGGALARLLLFSSDMHVILHDIHHGLAEGKCLDLQHDLSILGDDTHRIQWTQHIKDLATCDIIVITAGLARTPGIQREALLISNANILKTLGTALREDAYQGILIVVTNPVDSMAWWTHHVMGGDPKRVLGMAGILDTGRFRWSLGHHLGLHSANCAGTVIGPHNEEMFVPQSTLSIAGAPFNDDAVLEKALYDTRTGGARIVQCLEKGSAFFAPAQAIATMIRAIAYDQRVILPCSTMMTGQYGIEGVFCGMPTLLGAGGACGLYPPVLTDAETAFLKKGVANLKQHQALLLG